MSQLPEAFIALKKSRVKSTGNTVYLRDGQEFEIELFNPKQKTVLAAIKINGTLISGGGIVLKPGQRVFLERYIDKPQKFLFETYVVDGSEEAQKAIVKNGDVEISFYDEKESNILPYITTTNVNPWQNLNWSYTTNNLFNSKSIKPLDSLRATTSSAKRSSGIGGQSVNSFFSRSATPDEGSACMDSMSFMADTNISKSLETGRIEAGSRSNQKFDTYQGEFQSWASNTVSIKLLPISAKPIEIKELVEYCTNCGAKNKKFKFCPKCGTKF